MSDVLKDFTDDALKQELDRRRAKYWADRAEAARQSFNSKSLRDRLVLILTDHITFSYTPGVWVLTQDDPNKLVNDVVALVTDGDCKEQDEK